jgi:hypothetical protein
MRGFSHWIAKKNTHQPNSILYAIETSAGERGTITDAYGPKGDPIITQFIQQVESFEKKTDKDKHL